MTKKLLLLCHLVWALLQHLLRMLLQQQQQWQHMESHCEARMQPQQKPAIKTVSCVLAAAAAVVQVQAAGMHCLLLAEISGQL
jgi:hypothetical protein